MNTKTMTEEEASSMSFKLKYKAAYNVIYLWIYSIIIRERNQAPGVLFLALLHDFS